MGDDKKSEIGVKVKACNELADKQPKLNLNDLIGQLSDLQDELQAHGFDDAAQLLHRALGRLTLRGLNEVLVKRMESKLGNKAS
jgi:hypothetical protein